MPASRPFVNGTAVAPELPGVTAMSDTNDKSEERQQEIAQRAYQRYCDRGCTPGADVDDWLAAEREVLTSQADDPPSSDPSHAKSRQGRKTGQ